MRIIGLNNNGETSVSATIYSDTRNNKKYYNLLHGGIRNNGKTYPWKCGVDAKLFPVTDTSPESLLLDNDNYTLIPAIKNKKQIMDINNNYVYMLSQDNNATHQHDILVLWEIMNNYYTDISYTIDGSCDIIGNAVIGRFKGYSGGTGRSSAKLYMATAPVLLVYGDCTLKWVGVNEDGSSHQQEFIYKKVNNKFIIGDIITVQAPNNEE